MQVDMGKRTKRMNFWVRRRSHIMLLLIGSVVVLMLFFNEEASWRYNMQYDEEIKALKEEIKACNDSAEYFRTQRERLLTSSEQLEQLAREEYRMQKPTEDVYVLK